jgi:hypothetical protein
LSKCRDGKYGRKYKAHDDRANSFHFDQKLLNFERFEITLSLYSSLKLNPRKLLPTL